MDDIDAYEHLTFSETVGNSGLESREEKKKEKRDDYRLENYSRRRSRVQNIEKSTIEFRFFFFFFFSFSHFKINTIWILTRACTCACMSTASAISKLLAVIINFLPSFPSSSSARTGIQ